MAQKKLTLIATRGSLDWAYSLFLLASTATDLFSKVAIFFTMFFKKRDDYLDEINLGSTETFFEFTEEADISLLI